MQQLPNRIPFLRIVGTEQKVMELTETVVLQTKCLLPIAKVTNNKGIFTGSIKMDERIVTNFPKMSLTNQKITLAKPMSLTYAPPFEYLTEERDFYRGREEEVLERNYIDWMCFASPEYDYINMMTLQVINFIALFERRETLISGLKCLKEDVRQINTQPPWWTHTAQWSI